MVLTSKPTPCIPQLIVGLGNPGSKYERTRHNTGFAAIDAAAIAWKIALKEQRQFQGWYGDGLGLHGHKLRLLKPSTYMNGSGQALRAVTDWFKLPPRCLDQGVEQAMNRYNSVTFLDDSDFSQQVRANWQK